MRIATSRPRRSGTAHWGCGRPPRAAPGRGAPPSRLQERGAFELRREGDVWTLVCDEGPLHFKDSRGLQTLHRLVTNPDQDFHVTDLAAVSEGVADAGDAGGLL